ncbi:hypothetical protein CPB83DRAFT_777614, partial [Crepidotus variabilis]
KRRSAYGQEEKVKKIFAYMAEAFPRFSLRDFLETAFRSVDPKITNWTHIFLADNSYLPLMDVWWEKSGGLKPTRRDSAMCHWIVNHATEICSKEASWLTDDAYNGPHTLDAKNLRIKSPTVTVSMVEEFKIYQLLSCYERTTPYLQQILKGIIAKDPTDLKEGSRNPHAVSDD